MLVGKQGRRNGTERNGTESKAAKKTWNTDRKQSKQRDDSNKKIMNAAVLETCPLRARRSPLTFQFITQQIDPFVNRLQRRLMGQSLLSPVLANSDEKGTFELDPNLFGPNSFHSNSAPSWWAPLAVNPDNRIIWHFLTLDWLYVSVSNSISFQFNLNLF